MLLPFAASCGGNDKPQASLDCFPKEAARWIHVAETGEHKQAEQETSGQARIYVDRSGSMSGYVKGAVRGLDSPFQDLIESLPGTLQQIDAKASFTAFGLNLTDIAKDPVKTLEDPAFYNCVLPDRTKCENNESRLNAVLERIESRPDEMALVLTDLWFTNSAVESSRLTVLQPRLANILASGRTISLYGIDAPFDGAIYDLPVRSPGEKTAVPYKGRHPLYILVVGSKAQALGFEQALGRSGSGAVATAMANGQIPHSIFTVDPGPLKPRSKAPLDKGAHPQMQQVVFQPMQGIGVQQFKLIKGLPPKSAADKSKPSWTAPAADSFIARAVWQGPLEPKLRAWRRADLKCAASSWNAPFAIDGQWTDIPGTDQKKLVLDPVRLAARLGRGGVYLLSGELERRSVNSPNPATSWMSDGRWNLPAEQAAAMAGRQPASFPTLNLSEMARIMENSLAIAAERRGGGILGFSVLVELEE